MSQICNISAKWDFIFEKNDWYGFFYHTIRNWNEINISNAAIVCFRVFLFILAARISRVNIVLQISLTPLKYSNGYYSSFSNLSGF